MNKPLHAPFPYFGGKSLIGSNGVGAWILSLLPPVEPGQTYAEPFAGALSILLARPRAFNEVANDLDLKVYNFWQVLQRQPAELARRLRATPHSRETQREAWRILSTEPDAEPILRAWAFVALAGQAVMGRTNGVMWSKSSGFNAASGRAVAIGNGWRSVVDNAAAAALAERMDGVSLENKDGVEVAEYFGRNPRAVIYCDPPYARGSYGYEAEANLYQLAEVLTETKARVALSGYPDCPYGSLERAGWRRLEKEIIITTPEKPGETQSRVECLWINYEPAETADRQAVLL